MSPFSEKFDTSFMINGIQNGGLILAPRIRLQPGSTPYNIQIGYCPRSSSGTISLCFCSDKVLFTKPKYHHIFCDRSIDRVILVLERIIISSPPNDNTVY